MTVKFNWQKVTASFLAAATGVALFSGITGGETVLASDSKNDSNTCLGTSGISSPVAPVNAETSWTGSYVYFGAFDGEWPMRFRVLSPRTDAYGGTTLFLDKDSAVVGEPFGGNGKYTSTWNGSALQDLLNGAFYNYSFTDVEKGAVAVSKGDGGLSYAKGSFGEYMFGAPVSVNDKIFLLDASEVLNPAYGYSADSGWKTNSDWATDYGYWEWHEVESRVKDGAWWLRSSSVVCESSAGIVQKDGCLYDNVTKERNFGVVPALNVDLSSVLFSTIINDGKFNEAGTEYKLTLTDNNLNIKVQNGKQGSFSDNTLTVPYEITGKDAGKVARISVLILDKEYKTGNENDAKILFYDKFDVDIATKGIGTVKLPSTFSAGSWGNKYQVYLIAEVINGEHETDYASIPCKLTESSITIKPDVVNPESTWIQEGDKWFYYDADGSKVTGWQQIKGTWYFFDNNGVMQTGWVESGGKWYYMNSSGTMAIGWKKIGSKWYFFNNSGCMESNCYRDGYWLTASGAWDTRFSHGTWKKNNTGWWYEDNNWYPVNQWLWINGGCYYFNSHGYMESGCYRDGCWLTASGAWDPKYSHGTWKSDATGKWYEDNGWKPAGQTLQIDGIKYTFDSAGRVLTKTATPTPKPTNKPMPTPTPEPQTEYKTVTVNWNATDFDNNKYDGSVSDVGVHRDQGSSWQYDNKSKVKSQVENAIDKAIPGGFDECARYAFDF